MAYLGYEKQLRQQQEQARQQRERLERSRASLHRHEARPVEDGALTELTTCAHCGQQRPAGEMFFDERGEVCPTCFVS